MSTKKDFMLLEKTSSKIGWIIVSTNGGHKKWLAPDGAGIIISGSTESDPRGLKNHLARMRKLGYKD